MTRMTLGREVASARAIDFARQHAIIKPKTINFEFSRMGRLSCWVLTQLERSVLFQLHYRLDHLFSDAAENFGGAEVEAIRRSL